jgi:hypothetical protein
MAVAVEAAPVAVVQPVEAKPVKSRCPHYANVREFFTVAREVGLDTTAKDRCRGAVGIFLGRRIESRSSLSGQEWALCCGAIRAGRLFW